MFPIEDNLTAFAGLCSVVRYNPNSDSVPLRHCPSPCQQAKQK